MTTLSDLIANFAVEVVLMPSHDTAIKYKVLALMEKVLVFDLTTKKSCSPGRKPAFSLG